MTGQRAATSSCQYAPTLRIVLPVQRTRRLSKLPLSSTARVKTTGSVLYKIPSDLHFPSQIHWKSIRQNFLRSALPEMKPLEEYRRGKTNKKQPNSIRIALPESTPLVEYRAKLPPNCTTRVKSIGIVSGQTNSELHDPSQIRWYSIGQN